MDLNVFLEKFSDQFEDIDRENIAFDTHYKTLESWDSLTAFSIQAMIEDDYSVEISGEDLKTVDTVEELFLLVKSKM